MSYINKSLTDKWGTPKHIKDNYEGYFDPCPYPTPSWDGLQIDWVDKKKVFVNPPYSDIKSWAEKCYKTWVLAKQQNKSIKIVFLIPARTDTAYFHNYVYKYCNIEFIRGRLKFVDLTAVSKKPTSAPFPSILCTYENKKKKYNVTLLTPDGTKESLSPV